MLLLSQPVCNCTLFIINIVLLISGDVETNPGHGNTSTDQNYCLTIYHHNIRSIRNKINDIVHIVQDFDIVFFAKMHLIRRLQ